MLPPTDDFNEKLLNILLDIPAFSDKDNRDALLFHLPKGPVAAINRSNAPLTDLNNIITAVNSWGQLAERGEWGLVVIARNALRFARGTQPGKNLEALLSELETLPSINDLTPLHEIVIGQDERLPVSFMERGLKASRSVGKVVVPRVLNGNREGGSSSGSGWIIANNLLITNYHVIEARDLRFESHATLDDFKAQASITSIWFDFVDWESSYSDYICPELVSFDQKLDYALLRLPPLSSSDAKVPLSDWGFLTISRYIPTLIKGNRLNIIQHPQGGPKRFAIRSNYYVDNYSTVESPSRIRYLTDTEPGASGSPIFNDEWQVVGLHHASVLVPETQYKGEVIKYNNQGILIHSILENLSDEIRKEIQEAQNWV